MASFGLIRSFDIDDGQLDELRRKDCFVLGYELAKIDTMLERPEDIEALVHAENRERVVKSCEDAKRSYSLSWMNNDSSESWLMLTVARSD